MEHFLTRITTLEYTVVQDIDILSENCAEISNFDLMQVNSRTNINAATGKMNSHLVSSPLTSEDAGVASEELQALEGGGDFEKCQVLPAYDRVEREDGTNRLVENTISLAANVTELAETHHDLVLGRG